MANDKRELAAYFPENATQAPPLRSAQVLPAPQSLSGLIPLPIRPAAQRPKVLIVDDEAPVLEGLARSWRQFYAEALDLHFWQAGSTPGLMEQIDLWLKDGWRPDAVVIDINMDDGGTHGVDHLRSVRGKTGCLALPVVLATGNQYRDLDQNKLSGGQGKNLTGVDPNHWSILAQEQEPETILYGKTADALFLGRIGEHLPEWRNAAQRRTWVALLNKVAPLLDGASIKVDIVAKEVTRFAIEELQVNDAFIRWKEEAAGHEGHYKVVAKDSSSVGEKAHYADGYECILPKDVGILKEILEKERKPVIRESLTTDEAGIFKGAIAGNRFLGVGLFLGNQPVGFISLLRDAENKLFSSETDARYLSVLARLLASALGRDRLMRARQTGLLKFAGQVAVARDKIAVCHDLAKFLHQELHNDYVDEGKVTVRLLDFGSGLLPRHASVGMESEDRDIFIGQSRSIYAKCVRENRSLRIPDVCSPEWKDAYETTCPLTRSELCVPLSIGEHPIGGVNLESKTTDFYRDHDENFVKAAAGLAASAIERIGDGQLLNGMADFVHRFWQEETQQLEQRLRHLLYEFCAYSALVRLERSTSDSWSVAEVEPRMQGSDAEQIKAQVGQDLRERFAQTWFGNHWKAKHWQRAWATYTDDQQDFMPVNLAVEMQQRADALLWLRRDDEPPHQALLLMWGLPPPITGAGVELLGNLARLFSELDSRRQSIDEMTTQYLMNEQAAAIGHVMQHFRHRLGNLTGSQRTHIDLVDMAHQDRNEEAFVSAMSNLRANARDIANAYSKSKGYIKEIRYADCLMDDLVDWACRASELQDRLARIALDRHFDKVVMVQTDREVASLVLFSLLENAADALADKADARIDLRSEQRGRIGVLVVSDNGPGVPEKFRTKLFRWGETTKGNGLGSSLAFARTRMRVMGGDLIFPESQPLSGALFEMHFPTAGEYK